MAGCLQIQDFYGSTLLDRGQLSILGQQAWEYYYSCSPSMQKDKWDEKSFKVTHKTAHSANLIGVTSHSPNTFLTSSEDSTVRLWDLRLNSSVKLIRNKCLTEELSNPATDHNTAIYIGSGCSVFMFDARKEEIFVEEVAAAAEEPHYDSINQIRVNSASKQIICCDDEGDIRSYELPSLQGQHRLEQQHTNICNAVEFVSSEKKQLAGKSLCVSGGFDSTLILWDIQEEKALKKVPIQELYDKYGIKSENQNSPFIHALAVHGNSILVGVETGHVLSLPIYELRKPKFILQATLNRITSVKVWQPSNKPILVSADNADSFCLFDLEHKVEGQPQFLQKYKTCGEPVQIEPLSTNLLVATATPTISIFSLQQ